MTRLQLGLGFGVLAPLLLLACEAESITVNCPELPLYDVRDGGLSPELEARLVAAGCITAPVPPSAAVEVAAAGAGTE